MANFNWRKLIKKTGKVLLWTVGVLILLLVSSYFALRSPKVQTWIAQKAAAYISDELKTNVTIGGVDIEFFTKAVLEDIYIEDQHGDTLLFAEKLKADIRSFDRKAQFLAVKDISLVNATIKLKKYGGERGLNYRFILLYARKGNKPKEPSSSKWNVKLDGVTLENVRVAYIDTRYPGESRVLNPENILVTKINANLSNFDQVADTSYFKINYLNAREKSGFVVDKMDARVAITDKKIQLDDLEIKTPGSHILGFMDFSFDSIEAFEDDFNHQVRMDAHLSNSQLEMGDLAFFAPELIGIQQKLLITGDISGTVDRLRCKNTEIRFGKSSRIYGNFSFNGLPNIDETNMNLKIKELSTNAADLRELPMPPFESKKKIVIPDEIALLGNARFVGSFEGFISDFVAHGKLTTAIGNLTLRNLAMVDPGEGVPEQYNGELFAENFELGRYLDIPDMGKITADLNVEGSGLRASNVRANVDGDVKQLDYFGYGYSNANVKGVLSKRTFDGILNMNDPNVDLTFDGLIDFTNKNRPIMKFDAQIDSADLVALKFIPEGSQHILTTGLEFKLTGNNIDNLNGTMFVRKLGYLRDGKTYNFDELNLYAREDGNVRSMIVNSDFMDVTVIGQYKLLDLPLTITDILSDYLPSYFPKNAKAKIPEQNFTYSFVFRKDGTPLQAIFPGLFVAAGTNFNGEFKTAQRRVSSKLYGPTLTYQDIRYDNFNITANNLNGGLHVVAQTDRINIRDSIGFNKVKLTAAAHNDSVVFTNLWGENSYPIENGSMVGFAHFLGPKSVEGRLYKTEFLYTDSLWKISPGNYFRIDSSTIVIRDMMFRSGKQAIGANGIVSNNPFDQLNINLEKFNLAIINPFIAEYNIALTGIVDSKSQLSELYEKPIFSSNTDFTKLYVNKRLIGSGSVDANWIKSKDGIYLHGDFAKLDNETKNILFDGYYYPRKKENSLDIVASVASIDLDVLQPLLKDVCSVVNGQTDGQFKITGTPKEPKINGEMQANLRKVTIDYLGISLTAPKQKITVEENSFAVDSFILVDQYLDTAYVYGHLFHQNFDKFQFDFDMELSHFLMLDKPEEPDASFYGKVFATGYVNIFGPLDHVVITVDGQTAYGTQKGKRIPTKFFIPLGSTSEVGESDFITFKKSGNLNEDSTKVKRSGDSGVDIYLNVVATPDAEVQVIFDKKVGDQLIAHGDGIINMRVLSNGDFDIKGDYIVNDGKYTFTLKNIINVPFDLSKGSVIRWNGDPYKAIVDADALYKANASVAPFFPGDTTTPAYNRAYPVNVIMHLDSLLMNPSISFDIDLPTAERSIQETVNAYTQSELEMNKQVLALMVLNSFITPQESPTGGSDPALGGVVGSTVLSNFVSSQLSNWLSQISDDFNVAMIYRPNDDLNEQELKLYLGTQLYNNRITIDGNVGVVNQQQGTTTANNGQFVGDVNVEYRVTDDGKVRFRAFNRTNDNSVVNAGALYTQGVGVFYREDFDDFGDLMERYKAYLKSQNPNRNKPKEEPPPAPPPQPAQVPADSTRSRP
jgi:hypothetical protein